MSRCVLTTKIQLQNVNVTTKLSFNRHECTCILGLNILVASENPLIITGSNLFSFSGRNDRISAAADLPVGDEVVVDIDKLTCASSMAA